MRLVRAAIVAALAATFVLSVTPDGVAQTDRADVVKTYADIGQAMYEDALARARVLQKAVRALVDTPSEATLQAAREAWLSAREPYMQTEVFRFGNGVVDEWEGKVNAWPLDEGLIDYVERQYGGESDSNPYYTANVIANRRPQGGLEEPGRVDDHQEGPAGRFTRSAASRPTSPPAITRSSFCSGGRISTARAPARATGRGPTTRARTARTAIATGAGSTSPRPASSWSRTSPGSRGSSRPAGRRGRICSRAARRPGSPRSSPGWAACRTASWRASG